MTCIGARALMADLRGHAAPLRHRPRRYKRHRTPHRTISSMAYTRCRRSTRTWWRISEDTRKKSRMRHTQSSVPPIFWALAAPFEHQPTSTGTTCRASANTMALKEACDQRRDMGRRSAAYPAAPWASNMRQSESGPWLGAADAHVHDTYRNRIRVFWDSGASMRMHILQGLVV